MVQLECGYIKFENAVPNAFSANVEEFARRNGEVSQPVTGCN
jgi:hypothetical protein